MKKLATISLLSALSFALSACGASSSYDRGVYSDAQTRYALDAPGSDWRRVEVDGDDDLAWIHRQSAAAIQVHSSCSPSQDVPLTSLTQHLLIGFTEREMGEQELFDMDGREALRSEVRAKLDGVPRTLTLVVLKKDGCIYDFALVGSERAHASAQSTFARMLSSFRTRGS